jgi:hypothetical protein
MSEISLWNTPLGAAAAMSGPNGAPKPKQIREAAQEFESLLIGQTLTSMRQMDGGSWFGTGDDQAGQTLTELAEQCVAQALAASGGFGLASLVEQGLSPSKSDRALIPKPKDGACRPLDPRAVGCPPPGPPPILVSSGDPPTKAAGALRSLSGVPPYPHAESAG